MTLHPNLVRLVLAGMIATAIFTPLTAISLSSALLVSQGQIEASTGIPEEAAYIHASTTEDLPKGNGTPEPVYGDRSPITELERQSELYRLAETYFADAPAMLDVIHCESRFRQFRSPGTPLISETDDVGIAQINIPTWKDIAEERGLDIFHSAEDNLKMARYIYDEAGIDQWTCAW